MRCFKLFCAKSLKFSVFYTYRINFNSDANFSMVKEKCSPTKTINLCLIEKYFILLHFFHLNLNELKLSKRKKSSFSVCTSSITSAQ